MEIKRIGDLEIEEDIVYQRRFHIAQRAAWALMVIVIVMASAGLIGPGLAGMEESASSDKRVKTEYNGSLYHQKDSEMTIKIESPGTGPVSVWISREYLENIYIKQMLPKPENITASPGRVYYSFRHDGQGKELKINLYFQPIRVGRLQGRVGNETSEAAFSQFVLP